MITAHLHTHRHAIFEISLLPDTIPAPGSSFFYLDGANIGIEKRTLLCVFAVARKVFDGWLLARGREVDSQPSVWDDPVMVGELSNATTVLLLVQPEYGTAANWRKRMLSRAAQKASVFNEGLSEDAERRAFMRLLLEEWNFTASLLTSPLIRHSKSPTLWSHRAWMLRQYQDLLLRMGEDLYDDARAGEGQVLDSEKEEWMVMREAELRRRFQMEEMGIVMRAAEAHRGNYHAWNYARGLMGMFGGGIGRSGGREMLEMVRRWVLRHPRDISGWGFLEFLARGEQVREWLEGDDGLEVRNDVVESVKGFQRQLDWKGASLEWFLRMNL
jgi:hypothetical protein